MAVARTSSVTVAEATGSSQTSPSITAPSSNPVLLVAIHLVSGTVSSVTSTSGLGSVNGTKIKESTNGTAFESVWAIVAPTAGGSGTVTANYSGSVSGAMCVAAYSGADQTTPCPTGDAVNINDVTTASRTVTPANLTANDATFAGSCLTVNGDLTSLTPNQLQLDIGSVHDSGAGDNTGTTGVTINSQGANLETVASVGVRIAAASGGSTASGALSSAGSGTETMSGKSTATSNLAGAGTALATFTGADLATGAFASAGVGSASFVGVTAMQAAATMAGAGLATFIGASTVSGDASSAGIALATFIGASNASSPVLSQGSALATFVGTGANPGSADMAVAGTSTVAFGGASVSSADVAAAGTASMRMRGAGPGAKQQNRDGWKPWRVKERERLARLKQEEDELVLILKTIMPHVLAGGGEIEGRL